MPSSSATIWANVVSWPWPWRLHGDPQHGLAGRVHPQLGAVGHAETEDVHVLARPGADRLGEEADADAGQDPWPLAGRDFARCSACSARSSS